MKNTLILAVIALFLFSNSYAQEVKGKLTISGGSKKELTLKSSEAVEIYAAFRDQAYPIQFSFDGGGLPKTESGKEVAIIWFRTTLKQNGKVISKLERAPMPFFPGDMLMPVETFDFISLLTGITGKPDLISKIPSGNYEVLLEAGPVGSKGSISAASMLFSVK